MNTRTVPAALVLAAALALGACGGPAADPASPGSSTGAPAAPSAAVGAPGSAVAAPGAVVDGLVPATVAVPAGLGDAPFDTPRQALVPPGWSISVFARVPQARLAAWAPDGALLVSRPDDGEVVRLVPDGRGGATQNVLVAGLTQPHGLAFTGSTLVIGESDKVTAWDYGPTATGRRVLTDALPDAKSPDLRGAYAHALKSVAIAPDGGVLVSVGSTANVSPQDRDATPERAAILRIPPGGGAPTTFTRGVRNGTGLAIAPDGTPWTAVNNRDNIAYPHQGAFGGDGPAFGQVMPSYVADHPSEELAALSPGRDLGYPYCNPDPDPAATGPGQTPPSTADPVFTRDVQTNPDGARLDCGALPRIDQAFGAHSAPLGLAFGTLPAPYGQGALVGVHGSWNRRPGRAPEVSFFGWSGGRMSGQRTLVGGFQAPDGSRWGRPVAAVQGPDGAVYVTDDGAGAVYRVAPPAPPGR